MCKFKMNVVPKTTQELTKFFKKLYRKLMKLRIKSRKNVAFPVKIFDQDHKMVEISVKKENMDANAERNNQIKKQNF